MLSFGALIALGGVGAVVGYFWEHQAEGDFGPSGRYWEWVVRGLVGPLAVLFFMNSGWLPGMAPLTVQGGGAVPGSPGWLLTLPRYLAGAAVVLASWWGAATLGWLLPDLMKEVESEEAYRSTTIFWLVVSVPIAGLLVWGGGFWLLGFAAMIPSGSLLLGLEPLRNQRPVKPTYARVVGHIKMGRYEAAEVAVLEELETCPDDYDGWMLLAGLYAEHFHDLTLAEQTVAELCDQAGVSGIQVSLALHRMADWHLRVGEDPDGARRAVRGIVARLPGSHFARMAQQRERQLPMDRQELQEGKQVRTIRLPALRDPLDEENPAMMGSETDSSLSASVARANRLVEKLQYNPSDPVPREELARVLVDSLDRVESGIEQVELLLAMPERREDRVPEWLAMLAAWQLRPGQDRSRARQVLERLVKEYPDSPQALVARRRLNLMELAARRGREIPVAPREVRH